MEESPLHGLIAYIVHISDYAVRASLAKSDGNLELNLSFLSNEK